MSKKTPTLLAFDTAVIGASVAICHEGCIYSETDETAGTQAAHLVPMIESVLHQAGIWYEQIDRLITTVGPGSFTGIRIGLATAQGIVSAQPMEVSTLTTLEALAFQAQQLKFDGNLWACLNAGKGELVAQMFHVKQSGVASINAPTLFKPHDFQSQLKPNEVVAGNGVAMLSDLQNVPTIDAIILPQAAQFIHATLNTSDITALIPYYVRPPDAKISGTIFPSSAAVNFDIINRRD